MPMKHVKTHWEARWLAYDEFGSQGDKCTEKRDSEHECRAFAIQQAIENGRKNRGDGYTIVDVIEVETHENKLETYSRDSVIRDLTKVKTETAPHES